MRILPYVGGIALLALFTSCATPVRLAGKVTTFALKTGLGIAWKVAKGIGRIGTKEAVHAIDLTADATLQVLARTESQRLVEDFWRSLQTGAVDAAYRLFSDELKQQFKKREFIAYVQPWAGHIAAYELLALTVRQFHVEVPTQLSVDGQDSTPNVGVTVYVSNVGKQWKITGWEAKDR